MNEFKEEAELLSLGQLIKNLPTRTIDTLEVGDLVKLTYDTYDVSEWRQILTEQQLNYWRRVELIKEIIPHEAIELLKEVIGNE